MIANQIPRSLRKKGPFQERFFRIQFLIFVKNWREERIIATLWGAYKEEFEKVLLTRKKT